jgi:hypothetical protein
MSRFPYSFPIILHVEKPYRKEYLLSVRDGFGRMIRYITQWTTATITDNLNSPCSLEIKIAASDPCVEALAGGNEIWVEDPDGAIVGKYRLATGKTTKTNNENGGEVSVVAYDYLSYLSAETVYNTQFSGTFSSIVSALVGRQTTVSLGTIPAAIASLSRTIEATKEQATILSLLCDLVDSVENRVMFYVDTNKVLQFLLVDVDNTDSGKRLSIDNNLKSTEVSYDWSNWITRLYPSGGSTQTGASLVLSDGLQKWNVRKSSASAGTITLERTYSGCSDPGALIGYDSAVSKIGTGDFLKIGDVEKEIKSVSIGTSTISVVLFDSTYNAGTTAATITLKRNHLDSLFHGCEFLKAIVIDPQTFDPRGSTNYTLSISTTDLDIANLESIANGRTINAFFVDASGKTVLSSTVSTLEFSGTPNLVADVIIPKASGVFETTIYLVIGWA